MNPTELTGQRVRLATAVGVGRHSFGVTGYNHSDPGGPKRRLMELPASWSEALVIASSSDPGWSVRSTPSRGGSSGLGHHPNQGDLRCPAAPLNLPACTKPILRASMSSGDVWNDPPRTAQQPNLFLAPLGTAVVLPITWDERSGGRSRRWVRSTMA